MLDWTEEEDQVIGALWGDLKGREDHIVPYPETVKDESDDILTIGDYFNKQCNEHELSPVKSTEPSKDLPKNETPNSNLDPCSCFSREVKVTDSRFHMDSSSHFPSLDRTSFNGDRAEYEHISPLSRMANNLTDTPKSGAAKTSTEDCNSSSILDGSKPSTSRKKTEGFAFADRVELDSKPGVLSNDAAHKEVDNLLGCDWGSISDFDDLDGIFSNEAGSILNIIVNNESLFGQEMIANADELLSPTSSTNTSKASLPFYDMSKKIDAPAAKGLCSSPDGDKSQGNRNFVDNKIEEQKSSTKYRRQTKEMGAVASHMSTNKLSYCDNQIQQFESNVPLSDSLPQQMSYFPSNQHVFARYGYKALPYPSIPVASTPPTKMQQAKPVSQTSQKQIGVASRAPIMTPKEKIEKLRRRQQMQAMLAIKQQEKQFGQQSTCLDVAQSQKEPQTNQNQCSASSFITSQEVLNKNLPSGHNFPAEELGSYSLSVSSDDYTFHETTLRELQEVIQKMDNNLKVRVRDSLFRLARNALERNIDNDNYSANTSKRNDEDFLAGKSRLAQDSWIAEPDVEKDTNRIDRLVTYFLFHSPLPSSDGLVKQGMPSSPLLGKCG